MGNNNYQAEERGLDNLIFFIITKEHFDIIEEEFSLECLKGTGVEVELDHLDLEQDMAYYIEKMEKFEIQCGIEE